MPRDDHDDRPTRRRKPGPNYLPWAVGGAAVLLVAVAVAVGMFVWTLREEAKVRETYSRHTAIRDELTRLERDRADVVGPKFLEEIRTARDEQRVREWDAKHAHRIDSLRAEAAALRSEWGAKWAAIGFDPDDG